MRTVKKCACLLVVAGLVGGCSSNDEAEEGPSTTVTTREEGPAATFAALDGGKGIFLGAADPGPSLDDAGYEEAEYSAAGTATSYTADTLPTDGTYALEPGEDAEYTTRVVVRRPADGADFNGTVVLEWLNVSGGVDASPDYTYLAAEVLRGGYAWVGVSAQRIGVEGGEVAVEVPQAAAAGAGRGLRGLDPERYGDLHHPGDAFAYDIYTQVARALRSPGEVDPLDGLDVERLLAVGESQSAFALTTYVDGVQPLTGAFDGFLVHSRGGAAAPLGVPGKGIDIAGSIGGEPTTIREDSKVPVIIVQTETDLIGVLGYLPARQPDSDNVRLWEVAGTAHADKYQLGDSEAALGCPQPINRGQQAYVLRAALRHLDAWAAGGDPPPKAARLEVEAASAPAFVLDAVGNVKGGVRTPAVDAPVDILSGMPVEGSSLVCLLMGSTTPLDADRLAELYSSRDDYLAAYEQAADEMIAAGFALDDDRDQLLDEADPSRLPAG
jgi:hypothetical protein